MSTCLKTCKQVVPTTKNITVPISKAAPTIDAPAIPTMPIVLMPEVEEGDAELVAEAEVAWLELMVLVATRCAAELVDRRALEVV